MAADATLVNAAFREAQTGAMADVPSMAPMFESQKKIQKTYMDTITSVMKTLEVKKEQKEIAKVQQLKPVKETIQKAYNALEQGEPLPQFVVNDFTRQIEDLQDQFEKVNTEGKGDTRANEQERRRITARLMRLKNQAIDLRSKYMVAFQDPSSYNDPNIKGEDIDAFNSIATAFSDPDASAEMFKNGSIRGGFVNGEYTIFTKDYSTGTRKVRLKDPESTFLTDDDLLDEEEYKYGDERGFTGSDMVNALPYENLQNDQNTANFLKGAPIAGKTDAINGVVNKYENPDARDTEIAEFFDLVKTDEDYYDMQSRRMEGTGMAPSFDQALGGMAAIPISVLNNMFLDAQGNPVTDMATYFSELDKKGNKDGKINSGDFPEDGDALKTFMNNIEITKEEILKNKEIGLPLMAEYFADMKIKAYNDNYTANTPKETIDYKQRKAYFDAQSAKFKAMKLQNELNNKGGGGGGGSVGNFDHINKGQYIPLAGVSVQKGSLENIRTAIESRTPGGFYLGPKGDEKAFVPVGENNWEMRDSDGKVLATYNGVSQLIKSGLKTSDKGFRSLITMDIDGDGIPDGPVREGQSSSFNLNLDLL